nr:13026_t:CDS:10 [Entrophospora candida]
MSKRNSTSIEEREWSFDRERIGNAGKGFGNLMNDNGKQESIADLIASEKDEDVVKLAKFTQRHADQMNKSRLSVIEHEKYPKENNSCSSRFNPSDATLNNSRMCKQFLETKYDVIFKLINNDHVYNPLQVIKKRNNERINSSENENDIENSEFDNENSIIIAQQKRNRHKQKDDQLNNDDYILEENPIASSPNDHQPVRATTEPILHNNTNNNSKRRLSQIFIPPSSSSPSLSSLSPPADKHVVVNSENNENLLQKRSKALIQSPLEKMNDFPTYSGEIMNSVEDAQKSQEKLNNNIIYTIQDYDESSDARFMENDYENTTRIKNFLDDNFINDNSSSKDDDSISTSIGFSRSSSFSARHSMDDSIKVSSNSIIIDIEATDNVMELDENAKENSNDGPRLSGETILVNTDVLPNELIDLIYTYQEKGLISPAEKNERYIELDYGLNEVFKFKRSIHHGVNPLNLDVSLLGDTNKDYQSFVQQEIDESLRRCDTYIQDATKFLETYREKLSVKENAIQKNDYYSLESNNFIIAKHSKTKGQSLYELKDSIDIGANSLNDKLDNINNVFSKEMKEMTFDVNNDYFHELKILEDEIQLLDTERGKSSWEDYFYLIMSYVLTDYVDEGEEIGKKEVIFLCHGFPDLWYGWRYQIPFLVSKGYRVIVPDLRGCGQTEAPHCPPNDLHQYGFKNICKDMTELMNQLNIQKAIFLGHDWGGFLAWRMCIHYPDRVRAVISICTPYTPPRENYIKIESIAELLPNLSYQTELFLKSIFRSSKHEHHVVLFDGNSMLGDAVHDVPRSSIISQKELDYYVRQYKSNGFHGGLNYYKTRKVNFQDEKGTRKQINHPSLMITVGKDSALPPSMAKGMNKFCMNLTVKHIEESGHWVMIEKTNELNQILEDYLNDLELIEKKLQKSIFACAPATVRGQAVQLGSDPKGENFLYANGNSIIIRNLANPAISNEYVQHSAATTVARYSPSGYYIASGDIHGNVRIWDATQPEQILKNEVKVIAGKINDLSWDSESKRIIAVGDGKEKYGRAFLFDTGSSTGEVGGHSKVVNTVSIRQQRPFRAATGSDDYTVVFYHGAPYKYNMTIKDHTSFVQGVKFSPNGDTLVTVGSNKIFLYNGKTGEKLIDLSEKAGESDSHKGSIYAVSWSPDSKQLLTSSVDRTVKLWDVEGQKVIQTFKFSDSIDDQQVGNLWQGEYILSLSLSGDINYLDLKSPSPVKVAKGHQKAITALTRDKDGTLFTGSYDEEGSSKSINGQGHTNQIVQIISQGNKIVSVGMDDKVKFIDNSTKTFKDSSVPTGALTKGITSVNDDDNKIIIATLSDIQIIQNDQSIFSHPLSNSSPGAIAFNKHNNELAVGSIAYSPDGSLIAVGNSQGKIIVYDNETKKVKIDQWILHTARINAIAWSPDGLHAASCSLDTSICVWSVENPSKRILIPRTHQDNVTGLTFLDDDNNTLYSVGQDACLKAWSIKYH